MSEDNNELANLDIIPEAPPSKRRKKKSIVWEHFTIETVSPGVRRALCKQCNQSFAYSTGSKVAGTSHLKRHFAKGTCHLLSRNNNNNQLTPYTPRVTGNGTTSDQPKKRYRSSNSPYISFDSDRCRHEIAKMIIMHDYPLHMVEHPGFVTFVQNLQPRFGMVSFNTVQGDCVATYLREKQTLMKLFEGIHGRICLTLEVRMSNQGLGYVFISGYFIDNDWKVQRRILNVVMEPYPDSEIALGHALAVCVADWNLEKKLFSITFNQHLSQSGLENLKAHICVKNPNIFNGQLLIPHCVARTLSSMAKSLLDTVPEIINRIRHCVKYVKTSEFREDRFLELKHQLQVPSESILSLDDQGQWNTTYQMLSSAAELKEVFSCLDTSDPDYKEAPSIEDWKQVECICMYLKLVYEAANMLITMSNPTAHVFFHEVWKIQTELVRAVASEDVFIKSITKGMHEKIYKYLKDNCLILAVAVVMDPRFKMRLIEFSFTKFFGEEAPTYIKNVDDGLHELFLEYVALPLPVTPAAYAEEGNTEALLSDQGLADFDVYIMETTGHQMKSELDQYLEESLLPRNQEFDVLAWWKLNRLKYPTLSKMARDILTVPVSTVSSDSVFDKEDKELDQYRSSLRPETLEAIICAKDWLACGLPSEVSTALVKIEYN